MYAQAGVNFGALQALTAEAASCSAGAALVHEACYVDMTQAQPDSNDYFRGS